MAGLPTRVLGDSGLEVPVIGLGANNFGRRAAATFGMDMRDGRGPCGSRDYIQHAIQGSRRLRTDVIDVCSYHQRTNAAAAGWMPGKEDLAALEGVLGASAPK